MKPVCGGVVGGGGIGVGDCVSGGGGQKVKHFKPEKNQYASCPYQLF